MIDFNRLEELARSLFSENDVPAFVNAVPLTHVQIDQLVAQGCVSDDWNLLRITPETDLACISNSCFREENCVHLPAGMLSSSVFENCRIEGPLHVESTGIIADMTLLPSSRVEFCGRVTWNHSSEVMDVFINAGVETGERRVPIIPVFDHNDVAFLGSASGRGCVDRCIALGNRMRDELKGVIGRKAVVRNCSCIENSVFMDGAKVDNALAVRGSILMPGASVLDGALVRNSVLQWNSLADSMAIVQNSIAGECATVERHGKLNCSFLGADSVLGEGEVTASVVGPLTGLHHQSLLIAAMWPGGRGNMGYGANIGSNHTSRLPDQEIRPGTGQFFGLGTSVKFPADFSRSPYTIIATGITTLPQSVSFPFSLITLPRKRPENIPDGWCQLIPGWMLYENLYSVLRNSWKFKNRVRSVHTPVETSVFTVEVMEQIQDARERLENSDEPVVPGAGKNYITVEDRLKGIEAYRKTRRAVLLWRSFSAGTLTPGEACEMLDLLHYLKKAVASSRKKDYRRGEQVIDDYSGVRPSFQDDTFLVFLDNFLIPVEKALTAITDA